MRQKLNRPDFISKAAAGAGGLLILPSARMAHSYQANKKIGYTYRNGGRI